MDLNKDGVPDIATAGTAFVFLSNARAPAAAQSNVTRNRDAT
jgi:hypothetical protein